MNGLLRDLSLILLRWRARRARRAFRSAVAEYNEADTYHRNQMIAATDRLNDAEAAVRKMEKQK